MTPGARVQAAIELLDSIIDAAAGGGAAADTLIARYFKERRYAGSKDRRAVRELAYRAVRRFGERPVSGRAAILGLAAEEPDLAGLFGSSVHAPWPIEPDEPRAAGGAIPAWLHAAFDPWVEPAEWPALLGRAPLDLRVNRLLGDRDAAASRFPEACPTSLSPIGLRLPEGSPVDSAVAWSSGLVEIQDEGSQLLTLACGAKPGMTVIDLCAGAGGKTLALAAEMANEGRLIASDADRARLAKMAPRLARSGAAIVEQRLLDPGRELDAFPDLVGRADVVLVDAPCSGSGTWRRNPETRWRLSPERLDRLTALQSSLIDVGAALVRPGGILVYAVCSLLEREGRAQAAAFEARSSFIPESPRMAAGRDAGSGRLLTPAHDGTDGFFVARWRAPC